MTEKEVLIKSKKRVQQHGEVFTPKKIVDAMVTLPGLDEQILLPTTRVLEPSVGEGVFLTNILERRLSVLANQYAEDPVRFENYALLALSSLYGIELLDDNVKKCAINVYTCFHDFYSNYFKNLGTKINLNALESAKTITALNIVQGDFLKRTTSDGSQIVFSEWAPVNLTKRTKNIKVNRTEYSLEEIFKKAKKYPGTQFTPEIPHEQLKLFEFIDGHEEFVSPLKELKYLYVTVLITEVYKQEMEEVE